MIEESDLTKLDISESYQTRHYPQPGQDLMMEESDLIRLDISSDWSGFNDGGEGSYQTRHILSLVRI